MKNRARMARERAGLSVGQAAKLLAMERADLIRAEERDDDFAGLSVETVEVMIDIYQVRPEWLRGEVLQHDYASIDRIAGADKLTFHDRDTLAEFAASMPRRKAP